MHVRTGFQRLERGIRERMTIQDPETVTPQGSDQHDPAGDGGGARVLRRQPALAVHGPDQPAGGADAQAPALGARSWRSEPRPRRIRRARRSPVALRPHLPDRDAGRSEHRSDRLAGDLRQDQPVRLHRDAVPARDLAARSSTTRRFDPVGQILRDDAVNPESGKVVLAAGHGADRRRTSRRLKKAGVKTIRDQAGRVATSSTTCRPTGKSRS